MSATCGRRARPRAQRHLALDQPGPPAARRRDRARRLLDRRHAGRLRLPGAPAPGAATAGVVRLRHQQRLQPRFRRLLLGHRGRRRRGGAARTCRQSRSRSSGARRRISRRPPSSLQALAAEAIARGPGAIPQASLLSVNVPAGALRGYQVTFLGQRVYRDQVEVRQDLRGRRTTGSAGPEENATDLPGSDLQRGPRRAGIGDPAGPRPHPRAAHGRALGLAGR